MALRLLEHEVKDVRSALADLPTVTETRVKDVSVYCYDHDDGDKLCSDSIDVEVEVFDALAIDSNAVLTLMERLGEIYDVARARAIRESLVASSTANR